MCKFIKECWESSTTLFYEIKKTWFHQRAEIITFYIKELKFFIIFEIFKKFFKKKFKTTTLKFNGIPLIFISFVIKNSKFHESVIFNPLRCSSSFPFCISILLLHPTSLSLPLTIPFYHSSSVAILHFKLPNHDLIITSFDYS
jgi:hypothetical protein